MRHTQVYLPEEMHKHRMLLAKQQGTNFSSLIRQGVNRVLTDNSAKKKKNRGAGFVGALKFGPKNLSVKINDIYK